MSKFDRVLSDEEMAAVINNGCTSDLFSLAERVEQAVLKKLSEQEPVAWLMLDGEGNHDDLEPFYHGDTLSMASKFKRPLYIHPMPNCQGLLDSSKTIAKENLPPLPEPHCKHGGGIGYFDSYSKEQMIEYAKSAIEHHRTAKNHIPDTGKNVVPEGFQLVPVEPTEEMHLEARDWSVKMYGKAIGFEASHGCYKAMLAAAPKYTGEK